MTNTMVGLFNLGGGEILLILFILFILLVVPVTVFAFIFLIIRMRRSANQQRPTAPPPIHSSKP
jgi:heme/copper-type cytochrome/quinol oxidase subunit 2